MSTNLPDRPATTALTPVRKEAKDVALDLINDPDYLAALKARLLSGDAGPLEVHLWRLGWGDPKVHHRPAGATDEKRFAAIREAVKRTLKEQPEKARELDLLIAASAGQPIDVEASPVPPAKDPDGK